LTLATKNSTSTQNNRQADAVPKLVLASASARRKELLAQIGIAPDLISAAAIDETAKTDETARHLVARLAAEKCAVVAREHQDKFVLAADTIVTLGNRILGKAADQHQARAFLNLLSGRRHRVMTGVTIAAPGRQLSHRVAVTTVSFKRLSEDELRWYLSHDEWQDKAGAYAIQGLAGCLIKQINGSYSNIVGLPLRETAQMLDGLGYPVFQSR
jgi:septum formation protein